MNSPSRLAGGSSCWCGFALALLVGGCAAPAIPPAKLTPEGQAALLTARSLQDDGLHRFLRDNLGHDSVRWDFEALCWVAFYYHPSLELARAQWATARAAQQTAAQRTNPSLTLTPGYDTTHQAGVSPWMPAVNFDFLLPTGGKRAHQQDVARAEAEAARLAVFTTAWQVRSDLRKALLDADASARRATVLRTQVEVEQRLLSLLEQRFALGGASAADVSAIRSALLRADAAAADAASQAASARARVAAALGLPVAALDDTPLPIPPIAPEMTPAQLTAARAEALRSRADVLTALAKYASAEATLALQLAQRLPDVHLGPGYQWDQGLNKWSLGITVELPIFNRNEGPIAEAVAKRAEAAAQFDVVQAQVLSAIDAATSGIAAATAQLHHARQLQAELRKQTALTQQRFELGSADQVEVQSAQLDAATAEAAVIDAENGLTAAAGQLEDALQIPIANLSALAPAPR